MRQIEVRVACRHSYRLLQNGMVQINISEEIL